MGYFWASILVGGSVTALIGGLMVIGYTLGYFHDRQCAKWRAQGYEEEYPGQWSPGRDARLIAGYLELSRRYYASRQKAMEEAETEKREALQRKWAV